jgi:Transcriptional regulator
MNDLSTLNAFLCVLKAGNLSTAARLTGIPKSTLSRRVRELEAEVGKVLLRREAKRLIPTEAGEVLARYAEQIVQLASEGAEALRDLNEVVKGELTIYADDAIVRAWLARFVQDFMLRHPDVSIRLKTRVQIPSLEHHSQVHFWLGTPPAGFRQELLHVLRVGAYASPDYVNRHGLTKTPEDVVRHQWVRLADEPSELVLLNRDGSEHVAKVHTRVEVDQMILAGDAIALGMGIGLFPHWLASLRMRAHPNGMVQCLPEWEGESRPLWLLYPHGHVPRRLNAFIDFVRRHLPMEWRSEIEMAKQAVEVAEA